MHAHQRLFRPRPAFIIHVLFHFLFPSFMLLVTSLYLCMGVSCLTLHVLSTRSCTFPHQPPHPAPTDNNTHTIQQHTHCHARTRTHIHNTQSTLTLTCTHNLTCTLTLSHSHSHAHSRTLTLDSHSHSAPPLPLSLFLSHREGAIGVAHEKDVFGFQVRVDDVLAMHIRYGLETHADTHISMITCAYERLPQMIEDVHMLPTFI